MTRIVLDEGASENGLALMLHPLLEGNISESPWKERDLRAIRGDVVIAARDDDSLVEVTLSFRPDALVVLDGAATRPQVHITASYEDVILLSQIPVSKKRRLRLLSEVSMDLLQKTLKRDLRVKGMLRHPLLLLRLARLMSVVSEDGES